MRWKIQNKLSKSDSANRVAGIQKILLENRDIKNERDEKNFLQPKNPLDISPIEVGILPDHLSKALSRIKEAISNKEKIIIFGDYDADGITATAVLWETLHQLEAIVFPFIPHRDKHGYGLSTLAIDDLLLEHKPDLIISVDNGIVAHQAAEYIKKLGIDLIITDHHTPADTLPVSLAAIHTTKLAGAGVAWILAKEIIKSVPGNDKPSPMDTLDLTTIGTVADQVPLTNYNRSIVKAGLKVLSKTSRVGLLELFSQAQFDPKQLNSYHINFIIAPRINAMGRLAHGLDSLRLLCTRSKSRAKKLSKMLDDTNNKRKDLTFDLLKIAQDLVGEPQDKLIFISHQDFHEGVIGLVSGKLTETHYRPSIVIGIGEETSKASARSVSGVNIIELIRGSQSHLINAGGHPMAAGFTIKTDKIEEFKKEIIEAANKTIKDNLLTPQIIIECEVDLEDISWELYEMISQLEPFGMGVRKPIFVLRNIKVLEKYAIGKEKNHLKILLPSKIKNQSKIDALWFRHGEEVGKISETIDIAFTLEENNWNGNTSLQLMIKDLKA